MCTIAAISSSLLLGDIIVCIAKWISWGEGWGWGEDITPRDTNLNTLIGRKVYSTAKQAARATLWLNLPPSPPTNPGPLPATFLTGSSGLFSHPIAFQSAPHVFHNSPRRLSSPAVSVRSRSLSRSRARAHISGRIHNPDLDPNSDPDQPLVHLLY
jgi:hypothetical protein